MKFLSSDREKTPVFVNGDLTINYASRQVTLGGKEIRLTAIEYRLLTLLSGNAGKVLTHSYIIDKIWGGGVETDIISLRVYMTSLRKKLKAAQPGFNLIETHIGIGYQMVRVQDS